MNGIIERIQHMNILVVEDEPTISRGICAILKGIDAIPITVYTASDGREAWEQYANVPLDLICTDIRMNDVDGLTMLGHFRRLDRQIPCIIISGYNSFVYAQQAIRLNVADYLLKPVDAELLVKDVRRIWETLPESHPGGQKTAKLPDLPFFAQKVPENAPGSLRKVIKYIEENYSTEITQQDLAEQFMLSPGYLSTLINKYTGRSLPYLLDQARLRRAAQLLLSQPELPIAEVARLTGYSAVRRLYNAFQKRLGCTPGEFRERYGDD